MIPARQWSSIVLLVAAALTLRADVLVLKNGTLFLGRPVATTTDSVSLSIGQTGTVTVRLANIQQVIACPPAEEPDSYLKAAQRAERAGWYAEAFACLDKSITVEPATASVAQALRVALQQRVVAEARTGAKPAASGLPMSETDPRQAEAQRMIAEGEAQLRRASVAASLDAKNRGSSARALQQQGEADVKAAQAKIDEAKGMLVKLEQAKAAAKAQPPPEPSIKDQVIQWGWLIGIGAVGLLVLRLLLKPFFSGR
jgi:hypothetical protein